MRNVGGTPSQKEYSRLTFHIRITIQSNKILFKNVFKSLFLKLHSELYFQCFILQSLKVGGKQQDRLQKVSTWTDL